MMTVIGSAISGKRKGIVLAGIIESDALEAIRNTGESGSVGLSLDAAMQWQEGATHRTWDMPVRMPSRRRGCRLLTNTRNRGTYGSATN